MTDEVPSIQIRFSDVFKARLRTLAKRYRHIRSDLEPLLEALHKGNFLGDRITQTGSLVFKVRIKNSDLQKGKSGGYRVIYQVRDNTCVLLIVIYSKSEQEDFPTEKIRQIMADFEE